MLKHFVVTRLGLGVYSLPWYESTLGLFEAITYPSLRAQTSQDFVSLVVVDRQIPAPALRRLGDIIGGAGNFHIVPLDLTNMAQVRHGCWDFVWDRCQDYVIEHRLLTDPFEYVITCGIDGDDAWHRETVELVHRYSDPELPRLIAEESKSPAVVRHTRGQALTFPRGLRWFVESDAVQPLEYEFLGMSAFVMARFSSGISALSSRHSAWPTMANVTLFEQKKAEQDRPMWIYVRHDRAQMDWQVEPAASDAGCLRALHADFGIDFAKVETWRANQALRRRETGPDRHRGLSGAEQLDCYFRITALNRQIAVLEAKQRRQGLDYDDELLVLRQREARLRLLERLQRQGHQLFE